MRQDIQSCENNNKKKDRAFKSKKTMEEIGRSGLRKSEVVRRQKNGYRKD